MTQRYIGGLIYNPPGGYSGYFDGSGDYLQLADSTAWDLTGDYTIEMWLYKSSSASQTFFQLGTSSNILLYQNASNAIIFYSGSAVITSSATAPLNQWNHFALVRSGGGSNNTVMYLNGVNVGQATNTTSFTGDASNGVRIGAEYPTGFEFTGYISNVRVVKGTAVYTTAFTPPNGPLQNITNTSLLTCRYPTFVDGSNNAFTLTVSGGATVSTQNPFPLTTLPNPAQGGAGNGIFSMSQYQSLKQQNLWPAIDPYFDYTTLLLHGNGTNGGQNNTFLDSGTANSGSGFTITRNGNTTQGTFSPFSQTGWSNYFGGVSGNYLSTTSAGSSVNFGTSNFTFECWLNASSTSGNNFILDARTASTQDNLCVLIQNGSWLWQYAGSNIISTSSGMISVGTWNHIAFVRNSSTLYLYVNGALITSAADTTNYASASAAGRPGIAGGGFNTTEIFNGYISNFRLVKGTAVYTAAFTPPTAPLTNITNTSLLTCQSNRFVDNSSNAYTVTANGTTTSVQAFSPFAPTAAYSASTVGGSGYFDGSGDYLTAPANAAWAFGTGDFTVECWVYSPVNQSNNAIVSNRAGSSNNNKWSLEFYGTNNQVDWHTGATVVMSSSTTAPINAWNHIAVSRSGTSLKMFINGAQVASVTDSYNYSEVNQLQIGYEPNYFGLSSILPLTGWVSGLRILKGTALYTTAFTPPAAPLTAIANTSFLANFTNAGIIDSTAKNDLETVGNAQISTTQSKFGGASLYFDGTGDYLLMPTTEAIKVGGGDFTIEFWLYWASSLTPSVYWASSTSSILITDSAATYAVICSSTDTASGYSKLIDAPSSLSANTWGHVAVVRSSGTTRIYLNGTVGGNTSSITGSFDCAWIGYQKNGGRALNGYIDDLRITKGIARYTSNFTPQTSQWQDQ